MIGKKGMKRRAELTAVDRWVAAERVVMPLSSSLTPRCRTMPSGNHNLICK